MISTSRCVCAGVLSMMMASVSHAAADGAVVVRAYNTYGVSAPDIEAAFRTVQALLSTIDIETRWRNCRIVGRPSTVPADPCSDPLAPNEVIVRVVGAVRPTEPDAPLGYSLIDPVLKTGSLATIHADRVATLSNRLEVDRGTMLGRAIAHEIGHLLLGTHRHSGFGLMRGPWSTHAIVENRGADWSFTRQQGGEMQSALQARARSAQAAVRSAQQE
jgi:hypothetical protein